MKNYNIEKGKKNSRTSTSLDARNSTERTHSKSTRSECSTYVKQQTTIGRKKTTFNQQPEEAERVA